MLSESLSIELKGFTLIGRYGCAFFESALKIIDLMNDLGKKCDYKVLSFHETQYENTINRLKGTFSDPALQIHESYESPCIFNDQVYLGSLDDFASFIITKYDVEIHHSVNSVIPQAEKRKEIAFNTSQSEFAKLGFVTGSDPNEGFHYVLVEIFPQLVPKCCERFTKLCAGSVDDAEKPGYIGSACSRIQKGTYLQFGKIKGVEKKFDYLEDEGYMIKHTDQGILGFVSGKTRHSNMSEFYITLGKMESFDKKYVAFGRVIEGMETLKMVNQEQEFDSLVPNIKLKLMSCEFYPKKPSEEYLMKQAAIASKLKDVQKELKFENYVQLQEFCENHNKLMYNNGAEVLELQNITKAHSICCLKKINLFNISTLILKNCDLCPVRMIKLFKSGFFYNIVNWEFRNCHLDPEMIKVIFGNKYTKQAKELIIESRNNENDLFTLILKTKTLSDLESFSFIGGKLSKESLKLFIEHPLPLQLKKLDFSKNFFIDEVLEDFFQKLNAPSLGCLAIDDCCVSPKTVTQIIHNKSLKNLISINLSNNRGIDASLLDLSTSLILKNLEHIYLRNTDLSIDTLFELVSAVNFAHVKTLDISLNFNLKDDLAIIFNEKPFVRYLEQLNIEKCDITNEALRHIFLNDHLPNMKVLDVSENPNISLKGVIEDLEEGKIFASLEKLYVRSTGLSDQDCNAIKNEYGIDILNESLIFVPVLNLQQHLKQEIEGKEPSVVEENPEEEKTEA